MNFFRGLANFCASWLDAARVQVHVGVALLRFPTLTIQRPGVWRYDSIRAIEIGEHVTVGPFTEIIVYSRTPKSRVPGRLIIGDRVTIGAACNLRAAGGAIEIGADTLIGQRVAIVAANHRIARGRIYRDVEWDESKTGVKIGANCWLGTGCILLPGVAIGDHSIVAAGAVVSRAVPENEVWAGVPARFLRKIG